jgi:hypothetical protein
MLEVEACAMNKVTSITRRTRIDEVDEGEWLHRLLADVHDDVARQPSPAAIRRMRGRLMAQIKRPAKAAA